MSHNKVVYSMYHNADGFIKKKIALSKTFVGGTNGNEAEARLLAYMAAMKETNPNKDYCIVREIHEVIASTGSEGESL